jgi:hypothetical protein
MLLMLGDIVKILLDLCFAGDNYVTDLNDL